MSFLDSEKPTIGTRWGSPEFPIAIKLHLARKKAGYTIERICEEFDLDKKEYMLIEYGDFNQNVEVSEKILEKFNIKYNLEGDR